MHGKRRALALGQKRRFTRSTIADDGKESTSHTHCAKCTLALHAEHGKAEADGNIYFQTVEHLGKVPCVILNVCIDIGSENAKVSTKLTGVEHTDHTYISLNKPPQSAAWIVEDEDTILIDNDRFSPLLRAPNARVFAPIKRCLYEHDLKANFKSPGVNVESIFEPFFTFIFDQIRTTRHNVLEKWVAGASSLTASHDGYAAELNISVATPSGLSTEEKTPLLTALYNAGASFMQKLGVADLHPKIYDLPESEAALAGCKGTAVWTAASSNDDPVRYLIFDAGGTTCDFSAHKCRAKENPLRLDYHASSSFAGGTIYLVHYLMKELDIDSQYWPALVKWAVAATLDEEAANSEFGGMALGDRWRELRTKQKADFERFVDKCIKQNAAEPKDCKVEVVLSGGGLLDPSIANIVRRSISNNIPEAKVTNELFSDSQMSCVLEGLQKYLDHCQTLRYSRSPITVLAQQDTNLEADSDDRCFVIMVNQDDPLGPHPLLPATQPSEGELVTYEVSWGDEENPATDIPFYAQRTKARPSLQNGLGVVTGVAHDDDDVRLIAHVKVPKPSNESPSVMFLRSSVNVLGRTVRTEAYMLQPEQIDGVGMIATNRGALGEKALYSKPQVHGLDLHRVNSLADMSIFEA
ncbi:hypothetical protein N0V95_005965 [Ascochyta clinopodiicola]|nr:hypothetical protein N0V95_005965 [Ascochyta clinopodiicola]